MRHIIIKSLIAVALSAAMLTVACTKEVVTPIPNSKSEGLYHSLLPLWALRDSPQWPSAVSQYAMTNHFTQVSDSLSGGFRIITYLSQNDTGIYVLRTYNLHDTLWSLHCSLFSPMQTWMQEQMARYETQLYIRHPDGYTGGSFYWFLSPIVRNSVDGGDVRSHDLFVQRVAEGRCVGMGRSPHSLWSQPALSGRGPSPAAHRRHAIHPHPAGAGQHPLWHNTPSRNPVQHLRHHWLEQSLRALLTPRQPQRHPSRLSRHDPGARLAAGVVPSSAVSPRAARPASKPPPPTMQPHSPELAFGFLCISFVLILCFRE